MVLEATFTKLIARIRKRARTRRGAIFSSHFNLVPETKILDLGGGNGSYIGAILKDTDVKPENVYIADINKKQVEEGHRRFGFNPVIIPECGRLPFEKKYFDIVFCSSVIEHVTVPKSDIWTLKSGKVFRERSLERQREFSAEIERLGKQYFIQTPNKWFPIESHTWLPLVGYLPRRILVPVLRFTNRYWIKETTPDWNLLTIGDMKQIFPGCEYIKERWLGMSKSLIALRK